MFCNLYRSPLNAMTNSNFAREVFRMVSFALCNIVSNCNKENKKKLCVKLWTDCLGNDHCSYSEFCARLVERHQQKICFNEPRHKIKNLR